MIKWRTALLGLGRMGRYHLKKIDQDPNFELIAVLEPDLQEVLVLDHSKPRILNKI